MESSFNPSMNTVAFRMGYLERECCDPQFFLPSFVLVKHYLTAVRVFLER